ncbi:MAG TPA: HTTM domain-containing protein [Polyangiaceae bacterium]
MTGTERAFAGAVARLARPVPAHGLAAFRALFGALMLLSVARFAALGWVDELLLSPSFHFTYLGFDWVRPLPRAATYLGFVVMGLAALGLCLGAFTRVSALVFCVTFTYAELIDKTNYLNHYYFVSLIALLLVFAPSNAVASFDARRNPALRAPSIAAFWYFLFRAQLALVYFYAGFAKLDADWLLAAEPLRTWLFARGDYPVVGALLREEWAAYLMSWGGAAFDLTVAPLLFWRRTRRYAYALAVVFHLAVWALFPIGMFSFIMLAAGTVFFEPDWPIRALSLARPAAGAEPRARPGFAALGLAAVFLSVQAVLPLRFLAYPGNPNWTEEAFRFAWRVMLTEKSGTVEFRVVTTTGERLIRPRTELTELQSRMMSTQPDMIHQYALHLAERFGQPGAAPVKVYADAWAALNGRPSQRLIDPLVDLAAEPRSLRPAPFIVPLAEPHERREARLH